MNSVEAIEKLKQLQDYGDTESAHGYADDVLCELLASMGYQDVVAEWRLVDKWYA